MKNKMSLKIKKLSLFAIITVMLVMITACGNDSNKKTSGVSNDPSHVQVITSFYPIYYMTKAIGGENVDVTNLIPAGVEPHDWTPKSKDLLTASNADLLLYHGAGMETWIDNFKNGIDSKSSVVVKEVSAGITLIDSAEEVGSEEMDHDHDHDEDATHDHNEDATKEAGHTHSHTTDPHTWVSPKSALKIASNIKDSLIQVDEAHAEIYNTNYEALVEKLISLDQQYTDELSKVTNRTIVVSHESFGYVARDYDLNQISIMGLNPNSEPRAQDILEIAKTVKANNIKYIFFEELVSDNLAKMLASEAKVDTLVINSLEGLTTKQEKDGEDYLSLMAQNLQNLMQALQ